MKTKDQQEEIKNLINQANQAFGDSDIKNYRDDRNTNVILAHIAYSEERRAIAEERIATAFEKIVNKY